MKIAFDEHFPPALVKVFKTLASEGHVLRAAICFAKDYAAPPAKNDVPWLEKFKADGGDVVITGDTRMRKRVIERKALSELGLITITFSGAWGQADWFTKSAMLLKWWPHIQDQITSAKPGQCFEVPFSWSGNKLKEISLAAKHRKPGRKAHGAEHEIRSATEARTEAD